MQYIRLRSIDDPLFKSMHDLLKKVFPPEEVLEFSLWREPLEDNSIQIYVAVLDGRVIGTTEYRYYADLNVAMTDFTIIGEPSLGVGRFLTENRRKDIMALAASAGIEPNGMFAEIYDPYRVESFEFGGVAPMNPFVRREVLSHQGYLKLDVDYVHPSWDLEGKAVEGLDLCFMPFQEGIREISADLVATFLRKYYAVLENKPEEWHRMIDRIERAQNIKLLPI